MEDRYWCDEPHIWAMFYASIVSLQYHPRNRPEDRMPLVDAAAIADAMYGQYLLRKAATEVVWPG